METHGVTPRSTVHRLLLSLVAAGVVGTAAELWFAEHSDGARQLIPWFMLAVIAALAAMTAVRPSHTVVRAVRVALVALIASATYGVYLHLDKNWYVAEQRYPDAGLPTLIREALQGQRRVLAPGNLVLLGFVLVAASLTTPTREPSVSSVAATQDHLVGAN